MDIGLSHLRVPELTIGDIYGSPMDVLAMQVAATDNPIQALNCAMEGINNLGAIMDNINTHGYSESLMGFVGFDNLCIQLGINPDEIRGKNNDAKGDILASSIIEKLKDGILWIYQKCLEFISYLKTVMKNWFNSKRRAFREKMDKAARDYMSQENDEKAGRIKLVAPASEAMMARLECRRDMMQYLMDSVAKLDKDDALFPTFEKLTRTLTGVAGNYPAARVTVTGGGVLMTDPLAVIKCNYAQSEWYGNATGAETVRNVIFYCESMLADAISFASDNMERNIKKAYEDAKKANHDPNKSSSQVANADAAKAKVQLFAISVIRAIIDQHLHDVRVWDIMQDTIIQGMK